MRQITFVFLWFLILIISWEALFAIPELPTLSRIAGMFTVLLGVASAWFRADCASRCPWCGLPCLCSPAVVAAIIHQNRQLGGTSLVAARLFRGWPAVWITKGAKRRFGSRNT